MKNQEISSLLSKFVCYLCGWWLIKARFSFFQDVGFSKEYEEVRADSCLDEYTAQDSQHPDNQDRNRYPNIVACKFLTNAFLRIHVEENLGLRFG